MAFSSTSPGAGKRKVVSYQTRARHTLAGIDYGANDGESHAAFQTMQPAHLPVRRLFYLSSTKLPINLPAFWTCTLVTRAWTPDSEATSTREELLNLPCGGSKTFLAGEHPRDFLKVISTPKRIDVSIALKSKSCPLVQSHLRSQRLFRQNGKELHTQGIRGVWLWLSRGMDDKPRSSNQSREYYRLRCFFTVVCVKRGGAGISTVNVR